MWKEVNLLSTNFSAKHTPSATLTVEDYILNFSQTRRTKLQCKFPHWRTNENVLVTWDVFVKTTSSFFMIIRCFCIWLCSTKLWTFSGISSKWPCLRMRPVSHPLATERPKNKEAPWSSIAWNFVTYMPRVLYGTLAPNNRAV